MQFFFYGLKNPDGNSLRFYNRVKPRRQVEVVTSPDQLFSQESVHLWKPFNTVRIIGMFKDRSVEAPLSLCGELNVL